MAARGRKADMYEAERAQRKAENRDQDKPKRFMFDDPLKEYAAEMLQKKKES